MSLLATTLDRSRRALLGAGLAVGLLSPLASADFGGWQTTGFAAQPELKQTLSDLLASHTPIREMASTIGGGWVIVTDEAEQQVLWGGPVPSACLAKIFEYVQSGRQIDCIAFTPTDGWCVIAEELAWHSGGINLVADLEAAILDRIGAGQRLTELVFDADNTGFTLLSNGGGWGHTLSMPKDLFEAIVERHAHERTIQRIQMDFEGNWVLFAEDWFASRGIKDTCFEWIKEFQREQRSLDNIMLGPGLAWALFSHDPFVPDFSEGMDTIEYALKGFEADGTNTSNIWKRMEELDVAAVSLGVIEDGRLRWARTYGELEAGTQRWAASTSPFDTASVSKHVASMLFMNLVDDPTVPLFLDINVKQAALGGPVVFWNDLLVWALYGSLFKSDPLPFTQITMRRCLSNTAAMLPHGSTAFYPGETPPSTLEILFGKDYVGGDETYGGAGMPWYAEDLFSDGGSWQPGEAYKYSGGGFMVAQAMAEAITGSSFHVMMQQRLLSPLQLADTTFVQPLPPGFDDRVALPHDGSGVVLPPNSRPYYPWESAGGMYSTPTDLAQVLLTLMNDGTHPQLGEQILVPASNAEMMTKQTPLGVSKRYGLGLNLTHTQVTAGNMGWFAHDGGHAQASAYIAGSPGRGEGIVLLINGGHDDADTLRNELYNTFKDFYGWN